MTMNDPEPQEQNKRVGLHPAIVLFGVIIGLWLFIQAIIPKSKNIQPPQGNEVRSEQLALLLKEAESAPVPPVKVTAHVQGMNALSLLVPQQTTDSQVVALLNYLRRSRMDGSLASQVPATTPGNNLGEFAIADVYIFSDPKYAVPEAVEILSVGAHAPGDFYQSSIPFEIAMEQVRGHYAVNLNQKNHPERASLGFGEKATGLYSRRYQPLF
ncbi:MAG: hypothetical protein OXI53_03275 [Nitrospira sp.]|nr:hypothetical protein [Nitrospira sp.]